MAYMTRFPLRASQPQPTTISSRKALSPAPPSEGPWRCWSLLSGADGDGVSDERGAEPADEVDPAAAVGNEGIDQRQPGNPKEPVSRCAAVLQLCHPGDEELGLVQLLRDFQGSLIRGRWRVCRVDGLLRRSSIRHDCSVRSVVKIKRHQLPLSSSAPMRPSGRNESVFAPGVLTDFLQAFR